MATKRVSATRGVRNNNPGNIRSNSYFKWQGQTGSDDKGFCVFDTMGCGLRALFRLLANYRLLHNVSTVNQLINRFAPPSENHTGAYIDFVLQYLSQGGHILKSTDYMDFRDSALMMRLASAIMMYESKYEPGDYELLVAYQDGMARLIPPKSMKYDTDNIFTKQARRYS